MAEASLSLAEAASRLGLSPAVLAVLWQQQDLPTSGSPDAMLLDPADVETLRARIASHEVRVPEDLSALESIRAAAAGDSGDEVVVGSGSPTDSQVLFDEPVPVSSVGNSQTVVVEGEPAGSGQEVRVESGSRLDNDSSLLGGEEDDPDSHLPTLQGDLQSMIAEDGLGEPPSLGPEDQRILHDDVPLVGGGDGSQTDISIDEKGDDFLTSVQDDDEIAVEGGGPPSSQQRDIHEVLGGPGEGPRTDVFGGRTVVGDVPEDSGHDIDVNIRDFGDFGREEDPFGPENFGASGMEGFGGSFTPDRDEPHPYEGAEDDELPLPFENNGRDDELEDDLTDSILAIDESSGSQDVNFRLPGDSLQGEAPAKSPVTPPEFNQAADGPMRLDLDELDALDGAGDDLPGGGADSDARRIDLDASIDPAQNIGSDVESREMSINFDGAGSGILARAGSGIDPFDMGGDDDFGAFDSAEPASRGPDDILSSDEAQSDLLAGDVPQSDLLAGDLLSNDPAKQSGLISRDVPSGVTITDEDLRIGESSVSKRGSTHDAEALLGMHDSTDDEMLGGDTTQGTGRRGGADFDLLDLASEEDEASVNSATDEALASLEASDDVTPGRDALGMPSGGSSGLGMDSGLTLPGGSSALAGGSSALAGGSSALSGSSEIPASSSIDVNEDFNEIVSVSEITTADQLSPSDSGLTVIDEEPAAPSAGGSMLTLAESEDDEFVLGGSTGSDITLAANESGIGIGSGLSGIGLAAMSGSGIDLASSSGFETSPSSVGGGAATQDQEFLLQPLEGDEGDESDSGSQVIALDQESVEIETAPTMLGAEGFGPTMLGGDPYGQPAAGLDPLAAAAGMAPGGYGAAPGYAPTPGLAPVVYQTADDPITFTGGDAALMSTIAATMAITAILMFDLMRSVSLGSRSSILEWIFSFV